MKVNYNDVPKKLNGRVLSHVKIRSFENTDSGREKTKVSLLSLPFPRCRHEGFCAASIFYLYIPFIFAVVTEATKKRTQHKQ